MIGSTKTFNCVGLQLGGVSVITTAAVSGTTNTVAKFTSTNVVGNSGITDTGTAIVLGDAATDTAAAAGIFTAVTPTSTIAGFRSGKQSATTVWGFGHDYDTTNYTLNYYNGSAWTEDLFTISSVGAATQNLSFAGASGRYDAFTIATTQTGTATAGDGAAIRWTTNGTNYNSWVRQRNENTSPGFLDTGVAIGTQSRTTTTVANAADRMLIGAGGRVYMGDHSSFGTAIDNNIDVLSLGQTGTGISANGTSLLNVASSGTYTGHATVSTYTYGIKIDGTQSCSDCTVVNGFSAAAAGLYIDQHGDAAGDNATYNIAIKTNRGDNYFNTGGASYASYFNSTVYVNPDKTLVTEKIQAYFSGSGAIGSVGDNYDIGTWAAPTGNLYLLSSGGSLLLNTTEDDPVGIGKDGNITTLYGPTVVDDTLSVTGGAAIGNASGDANSLTGTLTVNADAGANGEILSIVAGLPTWTTVAGAGGVSGSGTTNFVPLWTPSGTVLGNSNMTMPSGLNLQINGTGTSSHFYFGANEDTYIRGGKVAGAVYIGDVNSGGVIISSGAYATTVLGSLRVDGVITDNNSAVIVNDDFTATNVLNTVTASSQLNMIGSFASNVVDGGTIIVATTNNLDPGTAMTLRLKCTVAAGCSITGLAGGRSGRWLRIINDTSASTENLLLPFDSASSTAANRIYTLNGDQTMIPRDEWVDLMYDASAAAGVGRWRVMYASAGLAPTHCTNGQMPVWNTTDGDDGEWECSAPNDYTKKHLEWNTEWVTYLPTTSAEVIEDGWTPTWSGAATMTNQYFAGRPGILSLNTNLATSGQLVQIYRGPLQYDDGNWTFESTVQFSALSSTLNSVATMYTGIVGFASAAFNPQNGCYFAYDKGNQSTGGVNPTLLDRLSCNCAQTSTRTQFLINSTGNSDNAFPLGDGTVAAATWYRLKIVVTGTTKAEFYRNNVKVCEIATNLPTGSLEQTLPLHSMYSHATTGTGNRSMYVDQTRLTLDLTSVRSP